MFRNFVHVLAVAGLHVVVWIAAHGAVSTLFDSVKAEFVTALFDRAVTMVAGR